MARTKDKPIVGVDLGGTNMQIGVVDPEGHIIGRSRQKTKAEEGQAAVINRIVEGIRHACEEAQLTPAMLGGVGIGAPGAIDPEGGVVLEAVNLRWDNVPLARLVKEKLRPAGPVVLDNDVNAAIYGEWRLGAAVGATDVLGVWIGTGVGGGLILNGKMYAGAFYTAGEIGHTTLIPGAPLGRRSLEQNCSRTAIVDRLISLIKSNHKSRLLEYVEIKDHKAHRDDEKYRKVGSKTIAQAFTSGDKLTVQVVEEVARMVATSVANMVTVLSLPKVVLGGGFTEAMGEPFVKIVRRDVREMVFPARCKAVDVVASLLEDDAGLLGAAMLARDAVARDSTSRRR